MNRIRIFTAIILLSFMASCGGSGEKNSEQTESAETESTTAAQDETATPDASTETPTAQVDNPVGEKVYNQYCTVCHQANGMGVPNAFPPLAETEWVNGNVDTLISIVIKGRQGEIEVKGQKYNSVMTPHGFLSDEEVASVITYVRQNFGNSSSAVTTEQVTEMRAKLK